MVPNHATERLFALAAHVAAGLGLDLRQVSVGGAGDANFVSALGRPVLDGLLLSGDAARRPGTSTCAWTACRCAPRS